jgi:CSLREA domain-containing protein
MKTLLRCFLVCALLAAYLFCVQAAHAATFTVTKVADTNDGTCDADCSLREAITAASNAVGNDTIAFASAVSGTITLINGELPITTNITLTGPGADLLTISGNNTSRIFNVGEANFSVSGLTLAKGAHVTAGYVLAEGGAIINYGNLTLRRCVLRDNFVQSSRHALGGAIYTLGMDNGASLNLIECSLLNNHSRPGYDEGYYHGGMTWGGALYSSGYQGTATVRVTGCTFASNRCRGDSFGQYDSLGGAVHNDIQVDSVFTNCTFTGNQAFTAGAILNRSSQMVLNHCTLSLNHTTESSHITNKEDFGPASLHLNHTLFTRGRTYANSSYSGGSITSQFIMTVYEDELGALADNGGPTPTMAPLPGCPAINAGDPNFAPPPASDQRGSPRVRNARIDIGAYETLLPSTLSIDDVTVNESNSGTTGAAFTITLSAPSDQTVSVNAITANGIAKAPGDYTSGSAALSFAPGETRKTFSVPVQGDYIVETDETFTVNLSSAVNVVIGDGQGIGTITNDDNDVTAPTVRFTTSVTTPTGTTPANGSTIYNAMPAITGTATDAGSGISKVLLRLYRLKAGTTNNYEYWNGTGWISTVFYFTTTLNPTTGGANVSWSKNSGWPTGTDFSDGTYYMVATAYDKANKIAAVSSSFKKLTDNELPTVRFTTSATTPAGTTPVKGSTITGAIPAITGVAADAGSGISKVLLRLYRLKAGTTNTYEYWNGTSWISTVFYFTTTLNPATGGANVSWNKNSGWPTGIDYSDGTYYMVATAYDRANKTAAVSSSFKKATVAGLAPSATGSAPGAVTLSTAQALADGQSIKLSFTGALNSTSASQTTNYSVRVNGTPVEVQKATYEGASSAVTLQLSAGTLEVGDAVTVSWNLRDSSGQMVSDQTELTVE